MNVSTNGSNRSSYTHYENAFQPRLVLFRSEDGIHSGFNHHNRDARYEIEVKDIDCLPNQIITAYVHSANIPLTTYQFTNLNDTFFLYLPDWEGIKFTKDTPRAGTVGWMQGSSLSSSRGRTTPPLS